jgi:GrpB-like predicted nucleotidyltransferase (UPF0157 family)
MKYSFHPYHSYFPIRAKQEITNLSQLFPTATIEHFGSTAVPGLGGKGIIDISISVSPESFESVFKTIIKTDYDYRPTGSVQDERYFFQKTIKYPDGHRQLFHLHLTRYGDKNIADCLAFRDFLRTNPILAQEYSDIKLKAVEAAKTFHNKADKKQSYMKTKKPVIEKIILKMNSLPKSLTNDIE